MCEFSPLISNVIFRSTEFLLRLVFQKVSLFAMSFECKD